jgi:hypothetical protein
MCMQTLDRRVQVLFPTEQYQALELLANRERRSVGSVVREAVEKRLSRATHDRRGALARLLASADPPGADGLTPDAWRQIKDQAEPLFQDKA